MSRQQAPWTRKGRCKGLERHEVKLFSLDARAYGDDRGWWRGAD